MAMHLAQKKLKSTEEPGGVSSAGHSPTLAGERLLLAALAEALEVRDAGDFSALAQGALGRLIGYDGLACLTGGRVDFSEWLGCAPALAADRDALLALASRAIGDDGQGRSDGDVFWGNGATVVRLDAGAALAPAWQQTLIHRVEFRVGAIFHLVFFGAGAPLAEAERQRLEVSVRMLRGALKTALSHVFAIPLNPVLGALTARELEILARISCGQRNGDISQALGFSPLTLKDHVRKIYRKLDVTTREEAIRRARVLGLLG